MLGTWFNDVCATAAGWSDLAVFVRLVLACVVGMVVGMNREFHNKGAGMKTHVLVCMGSALTMIVSQYVLETFPDARADMNRIGAAVVSGVGFLGVGTIIVTGKNEVRGLTTAAGLWSCACIGLIAGIGYVPGTLIALGFVLFTFTVLNRLDTVLRKNARTFDLYVEFESRSGIKEFLKHLHQWDCEYSNFELSRGEAGKNSPAATVTIKLPQMGRKQPFLAAVQNLDFVSFCDEI